MLFAIINASDPRHVTCIIFILNRSWFPTCKMPRRQMPKKVQTLEGDRLDFGHNLALVRTYIRDCGTADGQMVNADRPTTGFMPAVSATILQPASLQPASLQSASSEPASLQSENQCEIAGNKDVARRRDVMGAVAVSAFLHGIASTALHSAKSYKMGLQEFLVLGAVLRKQPQTLMSLKTVLVGDACAPSRAFKNLASCGLARKGPAPRAKGGRFAVVPTRKGRRVFVQLEKRIEAMLEDALTERGSGIRNSQLVQSLCGLHELIWATPSHQARDD